MPNNNSKMINHLGSTVEKLANAGNKLPDSLSKQIKRLETATIEFKKILHDCLPKEILNTCWVVSLTEDKITISVTSNTAANHMRYMQNSLIDILANQSFLFSQIKSLKVIVSNFKASNNIKK